ncbi:MAG: hypothetical protein AAF351_12365 [Pseudomonadota bacterium]
MTLEKRSLFAVSLLLALNACSNSMSASYQAYAGDPLGRPYVVTVNLPDSLGDVTVNGEEVPADEFKQLEFAPGKHTVVFANEWRLMLLIQESSLDPMRILNPNELLVGHSYTLTIQDGEDGNPRVTLTDDVTGEARAHARVR